MYHLKGNLSAKKGFSWIWKEETSSIIMDGVIIWYPRANGPFYSCAVHYGPSYGTAYICGFRFYEWYPSQRVVLLYTHGPKSDDRGTWSPISGTLLCLSQLWQ
jgi:hypothetical protein